MDSFGNEPLGLEGGSGSVIGSGCDSNSWIISANEDSGKSPR